MIVNFKNRTVEIVSIADVDSRDYPDFADAYIEEAFWTDSGKLLTDDECEQLQDLHSDVVWEMAYDSLH